MRFAYADPPYLGCCRLYDHHHNDGGMKPWDGLCWDDVDTHRLLIAYLFTNYPDGWALSCHANNLDDLLPLIPRSRRRIAVWAKPFHAYKKGVRPAYSWEPIIFYAGRNQQPPVPEKGGKAITPKDHRFADSGEEPLLVKANITLKKGLTGAKPEPVCEYVCDLLGVQAGDELDDLFTGTGVMDRVFAVRTTTEEVA